MRKNISKEVAGSYVKKLLTLLSVTVGSDDTL